MRWILREQFLGLIASSKAQKFFARLTLVNKDMPLLLQGEGISKACSYVLIPERQC